MSKKRMARNVIRDILAGARPIEITRSPVNNIYIYINYYYYYYCQLLIDESEKVS